MNQPELLYVRLCSTDDISEGALKRFLIEGEEILLARFEGKYYALEERCTHRGGPLSEGSLEDGAVTCPWHFGQFSLTTGQVVGPPPTMALKTHMIRVENGSVFVSKPGRSST